MFAVIRTGGKQYKVAKNDIIKVEKLNRGAGMKPCEPGEILLFDEVLAAGDGSSITLGSPLITNIKVSGEVIAQKKDDKVIIFKKKRRHNYRRKRGHRQELIWIRIKDIGEGLKASAAHNKPAHTAKETVVKSEDKKTSTGKSSAGKSSEKSAITKAPAAKKPRASKGKE